MRGQSYKVCKCSHVYCRASFLLSHVSYIMPCSLFNENQSISMRRTCKTLKQLHTGSLFLPSLDLSISVKSGSSPPAGRALA